MPITRDDILRQLQQVQGFGPDRLRQVTYRDGQAHVAIVRPENAEQQKRIHDVVEAAIRELGDEIKQVTLDFTDDENPPQPDPQTQARSSNPLPGIQHIVAIGAGKGGVGKSTIAVNLAIGLARTGASVGLMDGDIYGPSLPTMLGVDQLQPKAKGNAIVPFEVHGIKSMTIGALVEQDKPLIWRGPMAHGAFRQLATQTDWGELDYLIIDLPPGTGDVPLTMSQLLPLTGAVVVCTPQKVAQDDAVRALNMFRQLGIEVLGVVENMSYFIGNDGVEYDIFGRGGAEMMAQQQSAAYLGGVPINLRLRKNCDAGDPTANFTGDDSLATDLSRLVERFLQQIEAAALESVPPTMSIR